MERCNEDTKFLIELTKKDLFEYIENKTKEIERLKEKLEVAISNEETYRLEMLDITKSLGLEEETLFDDVKDKAERLNNIIKTKDEGIKALTEDLCDTTKALEEKDKEIERLNKQIEEYQKALDETTSKKIDLENIIKEVREKIESVQLFNLISGKTLIATLLNDILEILDKGVQVWKLN